MLFTENPDIFREVLEALQSGIAIVDRGGKIAFWNEGAERISGYRRHEVVGHPRQHNICTHCDEHGCDGCGGACPYAGVLQEGKAKSCSMHFQHRDGHRVTVQAWTAPVRNTHGSIIAVVQNFHDIHAASDAPARLSRRLGGEGSHLPDHEYCQLYLHEQLAGFSQYRSPFGVLRMHAPSLGSVGTGRGHEAEDALVRRLALAAHAAIDGENFFGRWATEEFLMLVANCNAAQLEEDARRLQESLSHVTLHWWGDDLPLNAFVTYGIVQPGDTVESLTQRAGFAHTELGQSTSKKRASAG